LLRAVLREPAELWLEKEQELSSFSELVLFDWAAQAEEEERQVDLSLGIVRRRPPSETGIARVPLAAGRVPTHPVSLRNDGRPPPTAVWGPDKAPRQRESGVERSGRRFTRQGNSNLTVVEESDDGWSYEHSEYEDYLVEE
jgi:hypothetical protein